MREHEPDQVHRRGDVEVHEPEFRREIVAREPDAPVTSASGLSCLVISFSSADIESRPTRSAVAVGARPGL
ncbi:hypothetical protein Airi01_035650 [Actinoallomurus iriomotensis]|uniref:Uncharacterized protein n=1 Tax=Actinoallomurus iriomotensis TaxID=478107 RepID=A0A9W6RGG4_9ACTN|nr:hypothetical protein Airi01_035650 [Actinoallomurus iriomotensis]